MLKIIILPAALMGLLVVYAMVEESVERRLGCRLSPETIDKYRAVTAAMKQKFVERQLQSDQNLKKIESEINAAIDIKFGSLINRARMWLAWKISP